MLIEAECYWVTGLTLRRSKLYSLMRIFVDMAIIGYVLGRYLCWSLSDCSPVFAPLPVPILEFPLSGGLETRIELLVWGIRLDFLFAFSFVYRCQENRRQSRQLAGWGSTHLRRHHRVHESALKHPMRRVVDSYYLEVQFGNPLCCLQLKRVVVRSTQIGFWIPPPHLRTHLPVPVSRRNREGPFQCGKRLPKPINGKVGEIPSFS
jgi:hypothetical protein